MKKLILMAILTPCFGTISLAQNTQWNLYPSSTGDTTLADTTQLVEEQIVRQAYIDTFALENATLYADPRIERLLEIKTINQKEFPGIAGFRIQLFYGSGAQSRKQAASIQAEFLKLYPTIGCYEVFQTPNFKVRVGDFRSKLEATKFLKDVKDDFPDAYIVKDKILLPKLEED